VFAPFALLGVPALVCCAGFAMNGLPMSIQLVGRPFEDARLLGIAHAYERATGWYQRRPRVEQTKRPMPVMRAAPPPPVADTAMFTRCEAAARHAGVPLNDAQIAVLASNAVHLMAMTARVRDNASAWQDPASVFVR
jgi:aspartyl-tRNA(Asn)/glutamyl-tRNA(Gln) amidotransferase subunit A